MSEAREVLSWEQQKFQQEHTKRKRARELLPETIFRQRVRAPEGDSKAADNESEEQILFQVDGHE